MEFMLKLPVAPSQEKISYGAKVLMTGSCFSDEIGRKLEQLKFTTCLNPNGTIFDPLSISRSLKQYASGEMYDADHLNYFNNLWHSWDHHSAFSDADKNTTVQKIQQASRSAIEFIHHGKWLIITFGSSFVYQLIQQQKDVTNCHKAPASWFNKKLISQQELQDAMALALTDVLTINPGVKIIFTVSPVRHIRDGVVDNNRSKAALIELCHSLCEKFSNASYFPAYELVTDILRDYRFYKEDMVHPNELAVNYVFNYFAETYFNVETMDIMKQVQALLTAKKHKPFHENSKAYQTFLQQNLIKAQKLQQEYQFINLEEEIRFFGNV